MDEPAKLALLKTIVGAVYDDSMLAAYLLLAAEKILRRAYPYNPEKVTVPGKYATLQCEIAAYLLNKRGAEGEISHGENDINRAYASADVPESMLTHIVPCVGVL